MQNYKLSIDLKIYLYPFKAHSNVSHA